jgi:putative transcriptional regulator
MVHRKKSVSAFRSLVVPLTLCALLMATPARAEDVQKFLVARPSLNDPLFGQSVILMLPPPANPVVAGVIINKPTAIPVKQVYPRAVDLKDPSDVVYFGGPVEPEATLLLRRTSSPTQDERHVFGDLYVSVDPRNIAAILKDPNLDRSNLRLFLGYSQWGVSQLQAEKMDGSWYDLPATADLVFTSKPRELWHELARHANYLKVKATPSDSAFATLVPSLPSLTPPN